MLGLGKWKLWPAALVDKDLDRVQTNIDDAVFQASVRFAHRRYLAGQAILAVSVKEKVWAGRELSHVVLPGDMVPMLLRILRGAPGSLSTLETIKSIDLELQRHMRHPGTPLHAAVERRLDQLWRMLADVGIGQMKRDQNGAKVLAQVHALFTFCCDNCVADAKSCAGLYFRHWAVSLQLGSRTEGFVLAKHNPIDVGESNCYPDDLNCGSGS